MPKVGIDGDGNAANDPVSFVVNAARARISGIEASAEAERNGLRFSLAATLTDARRGVDLVVFVRSVFDTTFASAGGVITPAITSTSLVYNEPRVAGVQLRFTLGGH